MDTKDISNIIKLLNEKFTKQECEKVFEKDGPRVWGKHWLFHSNSDFGYFYNHLEQFNKGAYFKYKDSLDIWLEDTLSKLVTPLGYKLVKI